MKSGIYKITSPSNKVYIGQSINIDERIRKYKILRCKNQPKIYNSLKKYGPKNHTFEVIEECKIEYLTIKEIFYKQQLIDEFGWEMALFCDIYDRGVGGLRSQQTRDKISKSNTGKIRSEEYKLNQSNKMKGRKQSPETIQKRTEKNKGKKRTKETCLKLKNSMLGKKRSEETKRKLSIRECYKNPERGVKISQNRNNKLIGEKNSKKVLQICPITSNIIKEWNSRNEIIKAGYGGIVGAITRGKIYKDYLWIYKEKFGC